MRPVRLFHELNRHYYLDNYKRRKHIQIKNWGFNLIF